MTPDLLRSPSLYGAKRRTYLGTAACLLVIGVLRLWALWNEPPRDWSSVSLAASMVGLGVWLVAALLSGRVKLATIERTFLGGYVGVYLVFVAQVLLTDDQMLSSSGLSELALMALSAAAFLFLPVRRAAPWIAAMLTGHLLTSWLMALLHPNADQVFLQLIRDLLVFGTLLLMVLLSKHRTAWLKARDSARAMRAIALTDDLTGLPNRRAAYRSFEEAMKARQTPLSVLLLDIDNFKRVNDTFGHEAGDQVIQQVTAALHLALGNSGMLVRWGGEEFLAVLGGVTLTQAAEYGETLRAAVARLSCAHGPITVSVGVAGRASTDTVASLVHRADQGLYRAKSSGKNRVVMQEI